MKATASNTIKKIQLSPIIAVYMCCQRSLWFLSKRERWTAGETVYFCVQWHLLLSTTLLSPFKNKNFPSASLSLRKKKFQSGGLRLQKALGCLNLFEVGIVWSVWVPETCVLLIYQPSYNLWLQGAGEKWLPTFTSDVWEGRLSPSDTVNASLSGNEMLSNYWSTFCWPIASRKRVRPLNICMCTQLGCFQ